MVLHLSNDHAPLGSSVARNSALSLSLVVITTVKWSATQALALRVLSMARAGVTVAVNSSKSSDALTRSRAVVAPVESLSTVDLTPAPTDATTDLALLAESP